MKQTKEKIEEIKKLKLSNHVLRPVKEIRKDIEKLDFNANFRKLARLLFNITSFYKQLEETLAKIKTDDKSSEKTLYKNT